MNGSERRKEVQDQIYVMEAILGYVRSQDGGEFYQVKWEGYAVEESTWEPAANILMPNEQMRADMERLKKEFNEKQRVRGSSKRVKTSVPRATPLRTETKVVDKPLKSHPTTVRRLVIKRGAKQSTKKVNDGVHVVVMKDGVESVLQLQEAVKNAPAELLQYLVDNIRFVPRRA